MYCGIISRSEIWSLWGIDPIHKREEHINCRGNTVSYSLLCIYLGPLHTSGPTLQGPLVDIWNIQIRPLKLRCQRRSCRVSNVLCQTWRRYRVVSSCFPQTLKSFISQNFHPPPPPKIEISKFIPQQSPTLVWLERRTQRIFILIMRNYGSHYQMSWSAKIDLRKEHISWMTRGTGWMYKRENQ